jgi:hypothetical protein
MKQRRHECDAMKKTMMAALVGAFFILGCDPADKPSGDLEWPRVHADAGGAPFGGGEADGGEADASEVIDADSGDVDHSFRAMSITCSGPCRSPRSVATLVG